MDSPSDKRAKLYTLAVAIASNAVQVPPTDPCCRAGHAAVHPAEHPVRQMVPALLIQWEPCSPCAVFRRLPSLVHTHRAYKRKTSANLQPAKNRITTNLYIRPTVLSNKNVGLFQPRRKFIEQRKY